MTPEKKREYRKQYYAQNRDKIMLKNMEYYYQNREKILERSREYYYQNREKILERQRERRADIRGLILAAEFIILQEQLPKMLAEAKRKEAMKNPPISDEPIALSIVQKRAE